MNHIRYRTASGKTLSDADIDELANEVETTDYDTQILKTRRRGRPSLVPHRQRSFPFDSSSSRSRSRADHRSRSEHEATLVVGQEPGERRDLREVVAVIP
jgi:hypothetical protein